MKNTQVVAELTQLKRKLRDIHTMVSAMESTVKQVDGLLRHFGQAVHASSEPENLIEDRR